jgi:hypothetical protein
MKKTILVSVAVLMFTSFGFAKRSMMVLTQFSLANQTGSTGGVLYTPQTAGYFRITFFLHCEGGVQGCGIQNRGGYITYTDGGNTFTDGGIGQESPLGGIAMIHADANTPITWSTSALAGDTSVYDVYILVEQPGPQTTQVTLTSSLNPSQVNQTVTFTAVVAGDDVEIPTGTVTFTINWNKPVTVALTNGQATFDWTFLYSAPRTVTASYSGDSDNLVSVSPTLNQTVNP